MNVKEIVAFNDNIVKHISTLKRIEKGQQTISTIAEIVSNDPKFDKTASTIIFKMSNFENMREVENALKGDLSIEISPGVRVLPQEIGDRYADIIIDNTYNQSEKLDPSEMLIMLDAYNKILNKRHREITNLIEKEYKKTK